MLLAATARGSRRATGAGRQAANGRSGGELTSAKPIRRLRCKGFSCVSGSVQGGDGMSASSRRWERVRAHTRACILEAAAQAFEESGNADTCMHRIAEIAGFTKATVYAGTKTWLFAAVMEMHASNFPVPTIPDNSLPNTEATLTLFHQAFSRAAARSRQCGLPGDLLHNPLAGAAVPDPKRTSRAVQ